MPRLTVVRAFVLWVAISLTVTGGRASAQDAAPDKDAAVTAQDSASQNPKPAVEAELLWGEKDGGAIKDDLPDMRGALTKLAAFTLLMLAVLVGAVVGLKRLTRGRLNLGGTKRPLQVVDRISLGPKSGVCLVNACGHYLVLGVAEREISVLLEVPITQEDASGPENPEAPREKNEATAADFSGALAAAGIERDPARALAQ